MVRFTIDRHGLVETKARKPKTLKQALMQSIAKWKFVAENVRLIADDGGLETCGLCQFFLDAHLSVQCKKCPVYKATGTAYCGNTPYSTFYLIPLGRPEKRKAHALAEVNFLKLLRYRIKGG